MPNVNNPFGLRPYGRLGAAPYNGSPSLYFIPQSDSNAYYIGDVVTSAANGEVNTGASAVTLLGTRGSAYTGGGALPRGVITGVMANAGNANPGGGAIAGADPDNLNITWIPAVKTKPYWVLVLDDPFMLFTAQVDSIALTAYNKNCPLFVGAVPTAPRALSQSYAQGSAAATTAALPLRLYGSSQNNPINDLSSPFATMLVKFNQHELLGASAGV